MKRACESNENLQRAKTDVNNNKNIIQQYDKGRLVGVSLPSVGRLSAPPRFQHSSHGQTSASQQNPGLILGDHTVLTERPRNLAPRGSAGIAVSCGSLPSAPNAAPAPSSWVAQQNSCASQPHQHDAWRYEHQPQLRQAPWQQASCVPGSHIASAPCPAPLNGITPSLSQPIEPNRHPQALELHLHAVHGGYSQPPQPFRGSVDGSQVLPQPSQHQPGVGADRRTHPPQPRQQQLPEQEHRHQPQAVQAGQAHPPFHPQPHKHELQQWREQFWPHPQKEPARIAVPAGTTTACTTAAPRSHGAAAAGPQPTGYRPQAHSQAAGVMAPSGTGGVSSMPAGVSALPSHAPGQLEGPRQQPELRQQWQSQLHAGHAPTSGTLQCQPQQPHEHARGTQQHRTQLPVQTHGPVQQLQRPSVMQQYGLAPQGQQSHPHTLSGPAVQQNSSPAVQSSPRPTAPHDSVQQKPGPLSAAQMEPSGPRQACAQAQALAAAATGESGAVTGLAPPCSLAPASGPEAATVPVVSARPNLPGPVAQAAAGSVAAPSIGVVPPIEKLKRPLRLRLSEWIPHAGVAAAFEAKGVTSLYPWQAAALECGEDGHNLVYCAPTSGGKSLVAEILMIRRLVAALARQAQEQQQQARGSWAAKARSPVPRAMLVLPYVSIVSEKAEHLTKMLAPMRGKVRGYAGAEHVGAPFTSPDEMVAVLTMEKANSAVNRLIAEGRLGELCCVVVDEAHMVGDPQRGICLELCLTKLRFEAAAAQAAASPSRHTPAGGPAAATPRQPFSCQLVCMSATMSGLDDMCGWLGARLFMTNFRPVPLTEHAVFKGKVFRKLTTKELEVRAATLAQEQQKAADDPTASATAPKGAVAPAVTKAPGFACGAAAIAAAAAAAAAAAGCGTGGTLAGGSRGKVSGSSDGNGVPAGAAAVTEAAVIEPLVEERDLPESSPKDRDRLVVLVAEVAREGHSTLVFCASRSACQSCAGLLAELLPKHLPPVSSEIFKARKALLADLQDASGGYLSAELARLIEAGVAYHHAGLTSQERAAVERGFRGGLIHTLTATSTLAAGINLPARRVILRTLKQGLGPVSRSQYLQMIGRAGRAGQSAIGEAFLIGNGAPHTLQGEWRDVCRLMTARLPPLRCCLLDTPAGDNTLPASKVAVQLGGSGAGGGAAGQTAAGKPQQRQPQHTTAGKQPLGGAGKPPGAAEKETAGTGGQAAGAAGAKPGDQGGETHLQRMLLEGIANGSVSTGTTVDAFIKSTLLYQQAGYDVIAAATLSALSALRERRLVTFCQQTQQPAVAAPSAGAAPKRTGPGPAKAVAATAAERGAAASSAPAPAHDGGGSSSGALWQPTQMGRAIYESCLPTALGEDLYKRLVRASNGLVLKGGLHLLFLLLSEPLPVEVANWETWVAMLEKMPKEPHLHLAKELGVKTAYAQRLASGRRGTPDETSLHNRFASACLMHDLLCEGDLHELEAQWGRQGEQGGLTRGGISRGQLQKLQGDLSKTAGMAGVMAGACGWWALQALLDGLSQQAAAGVRPELLPLMALPGMTGAWARGLHTAGIIKPALLAVADEEDVKKALAANLPRALRQPKPGKGDKEAGAAAAAVASSGNAVVARASKSLIEKARQYMADLAARVAAEGDEGDEDAVNALADELRTALPPGGAADPSSVVGPGGRPVAAAAIASAAAGSSAPGPQFLRGSARIRELSDASGEDAIKEFLEAWRSQPSFAIAVVSSTPLGLEPELRLIEQQQLGKVPASGVGSAGLSAASGAAAAPDGARPSAVNNSLTVPGPPIAAVRRAPDRHEPLGASGHDKDAQPTKLAPGSCRSGSATVTATINGTVEGLVVSWDYTTAYVLTFHHGEPPGRSTAAVTDDADGSAVGLKRKPSGEVTRAAKLPRGSSGSATSAAAAKAKPQKQASATQEVKTDDSTAAECGDASRGGSSGTRSGLWRAACEVLASANSAKVCWHAEAQLAALMAAGCDPGGQWDDPRVMAWMAQGTAGPQELLLPDLQRTLLPSYAVRVPLQHRGAVTAACRTALVSWALATPLRAMMAAEGVVAQYRLVEGPLTLALARTRLNLCSRTAAAAGLDASAPTAALGEGVRASAPPDVPTQPAGVAIPSTAVPHSAAGASSPASHNGLSPHSDSGIINGHPAALVLDTPSCQAELARAIAMMDVCRRLLTDILRRPVDPSQPLAVAALCSQEFLVRRTAPQPPPELLVQCPLGRRPLAVATFAVRACALSPPQRARAEAIARLLTRHAAATAMAGAARVLLEAASPNVASTAGQGQRGNGSTGGACDPADAAPAVEPISETGAAARFTLQRVGVEGRLGCVFDGFIPDAGVGKGAASSAAAAVAAAADVLILVPEMSSAPVPAPSLQQYLCGSPQAEQYLQSRLPLPVLFLDTGDLPEGQPPPPPSPADAQRLRPGLLLELQGPSPCVALQFDPREPGGSSGAERWALVATPDPLTRQPVRLLLPASRVWCARSCCDAGQCAAAAAAGQLLTMATPQVLRCPAEELLQPPADGVFVTVAYPFLHLAVLAHCSGDGRLVEALYQPQPWAAVAAAWVESQPEQLRRLRLLPQEAPHPGSSPAGTVCCPPPLELAARQVVSRALLRGGSHKEVAGALALGGGDGGKAAAAALVTSFLEAFPGVAAYREALMAQAKRDGHITLPSGQRLRPATRQLTAGGVAAASKLQRLLGRMQLGAAAAEVVRTAAALALQGVEEVLAAATSTAAAAPEGQQEQGAAKRSPGDAAGAVQRAVSTGQVCDAAPGGPQPAHTAQPLQCHQQQQQPQCQRPRASLVWADEAQVSLCVPRQWLQASLRQVNEAAAGGVMRQLGLRVPLHVSVYWGSRLGLLHCEQYEPGRDGDWYMEG